MNCIYIHGIIECSGEKEFGGDGTAPAARAYTVPRMDISAVVSDAPYMDFTTVLKDQAARSLVRHQQVVESVMAAHTVIPMKFGTFALDRREVEEILSHGYTVFKNIFSRINNKVEMDIAATWSRFDMAIKDVSERPGIKEMKDRLTAGPRDVSTEDKIAVGRLVKRALDEERERLSSRICDTLGGLCVDTFSHGLMDEAMICSAAFLLDTGKKEEFEKRLDELDKMLSGGVNFRCIGPLPPYSFYTAEVKKICPDELVRARKTLALDGGPVTKEKIEKAYRRAAFASHPDITGTCRGFDDVNSAYRLLLECADSAGQGDFGEPLPGGPEVRGRDIFLVGIRK